MLAEKQKWAYSSDDIHRYYKEKNLKLATNDNFSSYFLRMKLGTYLNNVHLINKKNQEFVTGDIKTEMYSERQKSLLTELSIIGYSSKSIVFECVDENYIKYAIKLLRINENDFKNFEAVSNLISTLPLKEKDAEKILQFKKYWRRDRKFDQFEITKMKIDSNLLNHPVFISNDSLLHIQMELMPFNLKSIKEELDWKVSKNSVTLSSVKYFIACELVMEILECVSYLHARKIYHLNLKPSNILISDGINGTFIKLSDFKLGIPEENGFMKDVNSLKDIIYEIFCLNINM
jgi:serine/threonine protein kinase